MQVVDTIAALRTRVRGWREDKFSIALVPTMGNLHEGHLSLVKKAQAHADKVVVSIFVNPLQFNDKSDLEKYPRTLTDDINLLSELECDLVFTPDETMMYPDSMSALTQVSVPDMEDKLCGLGRPGHFDGVATVVTKLFNMVQADMAVFGEKDYQQLMMIRKLVQDLNIPVSIIAAETCRENSGLALSSRNQRLNQKQRVQASQLYRVLEQVKAQIEQGATDYAALTQQAVLQLQEQGFEPEYVEIRRAADLHEAVAQQDKSLRILVAARIGSTRLIDNIACDLA